MDWFLQPQDRHSASALRHEIAEYLRRHARNPEQADDAELVIEELLGNAVRHTDGPVWVSVDWSGMEPVLTVYDLGGDFDLDVSLPEAWSEGGRGLFLASHLTSELRKANRRGGGNKVSATLRVDRTPETSISPPRHAVGALPLMEEADDSGAFGKEAFLRALVVQLAQSVEEREGPSAAEHVVAQVGTDVGGQMEAAYRTARGITERLNPEQIADCLVRLKAAIHGDFYVIEISDDRIVLGNRACPFGPVVQRSPALCRMTSSVFGGIASRNAGGSTVILEERIAVGDPECRVVVELGPSRGQLERGHRYRSHEDVAQV